jgi:hypothetical protein
VTHWKLPFCPSEFTRQAHNNLQCLVYAHILKHFSPILELESWKFCTYLLTT